MPRFALVLTLLALLLPAPGRAQTVDGVILVQATLLANTTAVTPGVPFTVGLRLQMAPHWHTYWQYSGDAGLPTKITWDLPPGFQAGPIQWPLPEKISSPGDIDNYGYGEEVMLLTEIMPPAQFPPGDVLLKAKADWLVCAQICVPGSATLDLTLTSGGDPPQGANADIFAKYLGLLPKVYSSKIAKFGVARTVEASDLIWRLSDLAADQQATVGFFPLPPESVQVGHPMVEPGKDGDVQVRLPIQSGLAGAAKVAGVLTLGAGDQRIGWIIGAENAGALKPGSPAPRAQVTTTSGKVSPPAAEVEGSLWYFLLLGFCGGLVLNVMPCVLPVISLKLFSFIKQADENPARIWRMGLAYAAGVFAWFMGFAVLVVALKAAGRQLGYSFQFQNPWFVVAMIAITFVFSLNLLGVFEIILPGAISNAAGDAVSHQSGYAGAFFQGVLATVLGSACTAPFFGAALGFAFSQSGPIILLMFAAIAGGMSAPFLLLAGRPGWLKFLPRPGVWMERVKQGTGFLMLATVLWLLWVLGGQRGVDAVIWAGALLLVLGVACWVQGAFNNFTAGNRARWLARLAILAIVLGGGGWCVQRIAEARITETGPKQSFASQLAAAVKTGQPVFVDCTASWCFNCLANERLVLNTPPIQQALSRRHAVFLKADFSTFDPDIAALLRQFHRAAVPMYVIYPAGNPAAAFVLPELLTQSLVLDGLAAADRAAVAHPLAVR